MAGIIIGERDQLPPVYHPVNKFKRFAEKAAQHAEECALFAVICRNRGDRANAWHFATLAEQAAIFATSAADSALEVQPESEAAELASSWAIQARTHAERAKSVAEEPDR